MGGGVEEGPYQYVAVANIYGINQLLNLTQMLDNFLYLLILILIEDQLILLMFYLEKRKIVPCCNILAKLVDYQKLDYLSTVVE